MRILFLTHRVPYPPDKGDRIRSYNIIKCLARNHDLSLMSVSRESVHPKSYEALQKHCASVDIVKINSKISTLRSGLHLLTKNPLTLPAFYSRRFENRVKDKLHKTRFDLIYIYSSSMAQYVLDPESVPKLMDFIDVDSQKWLDYAARARQPMKWLYAREGNRLREFERKVASQCDLNVFTTESELKIFRQFAPEVRALILPNGVEATREPNPSYRPNKLVFVGSMDYLPNIDAMLYFTGEILPLIQKKIPDIELFIVGRNPSSQVRALGRFKNVTVTSDVEVIGTYLRDAAASVIPLRIARGIQNKILEAMAHGVPVITTSTALDGITAEPGRDVLTADDPHDFAQKTVAVVKGTSLRQRLSANAREMVQQNYRWEITLQKLEEAIASISRNSNLRDLRVLRDENASSPGELTSPDKPITPSLHHSSLSDVEARRSSGTTQVGPFQRPEPFVSFIVPVKNEAKLIGQCLDAINNLDYDKSRYECIIVDNGSIDDTVKIAEPRGAKVLIVPNVTISALRNRGARDARGNYLAFIDADCMIDRNWLKQALPHFENPRIGCAGCHPNIPKDSTWVQRTWRLQTSRPAAIEEVDWLPSMNMLVKREAFIECGGFNESMITCEDVDLCYRLTRHWKVISDNNIAAIHFGEARTIQEFFRKERWRGQSSLQGLLSHDLRWEEVPSLLLPVYYLVALVSLPLTILSFVVGFYTPLAINVIAIFVPALFLSIRTVSRAISKRIDFCQLLQLMFLYVLYSLARTAAVLPGKVGSTTSVILAKNPR